MLKRPESELQFVRSRDPLPTVEVDLDCIPEELHGYGELVTKAMSAIAAKYPKMRATIYVYQGQSINFHHQTWSAFFGVAGDKKLLDVLLKAFQGAKVDNVRFSDYIDPSTATKNFHVQEGYVWQPFESGTWYADSQDKEDLAEDSVVETDDLEVAAEVADGRDSRVSSPTRFSVKEPMPKTTARLTLEGHAVKSLAGQALAGLMKPNLVSDLIQRGALR